jgi:hypothetical protein
MNSPHDCGHRQVETAGAFFVTNPLERPKLKLDHRFALFSPQDWNWPDSSNSDSLLLF